MLLLARWWYPDLCCGHWAPSASVRRRSLMRVFTVNAQSTLDSFDVTCPDMPTLSYQASTLGRICHVRHILAENAGVPEDLAWLHIEIHGRRHHLVSSIHPLHWLNFHTFTRSDTGVLEADEHLVDLVASVLWYEGLYADAHARSTAEVRFTLTSIDGRKAQLPPTGNYLLSNLMQQCQRTGTRNLHDVHDDDGESPPPTAQIPPFFLDVTSSLLAGLSELQCMIIAPDHVQSPRYR